MRIDGKRWARWQELLTASIITLFLVILLTCLFGYHYELNDDIMIKDLLSGSYTGTPGGYCIQILYPLGVIVAFFYRILRTVPWYGMILILAQYGSCFLIFDRTLKLVQRTVPKLCLLVTEALSILAYFSYALVNLQYSMTCAFLVGAALFLFVTTEVRLSVGEFLKHNIGTILLLVLAFCLRTEMFLLLSPFLAFAGLVYWTHQDKVDKRTFFEKDNLYRYGGFLAITILSLFLVWGVDHLAYSGNSWKEFRQLFDARTDLYDFYGIPDYDANADFYNGIGLDASEQVLLENYNYLLSPKVDAELMNQIVAYDRQQLQIGYFKVSLRQALTEYGYWSAGHKGGSILLVLALCYLLVAALGILDRQWGFLWKLPLLFGIRSVLWMYLILRGRYPDRITWGLLLVELCCLMYLLAQHLADRKQPITQLLTREDQLKRSLQNSRLDLGVSLGVAVILCLTLLIHLPGSMTQVREDKAYRQQTNTQWTQLQQYCEEHKGNLYFLDIYSTVKYSEPVWNSDKNRLKNYDYLGGWASKSPAEEKKLTKYGLSAFEGRELPQVAEGLVDSSHAYLIDYASHDISWLNSLYESRGISAQAVLTDQFGSEDGNLFNVYHIETINKKEE